MYSKNLKGLLVAVVVLAASISSAKAISIDSVATIPGSPTITDTTGAGLSSAGITFAGGPTGVAIGGPFTLPLPGLLDSGSLLISGPALSGGTFSVVNTTRGQQFLSGTFEDVRESVGVIETLFSVTGGSAASDFGPLVILSLASPSFGPGTIAGLQSLTGVNSVPVTFTVASVAAVVPLPASLPLLLIGLVSLVTISRRYSRKK